MIEPYKPLIYKIINKVPSHLRDDCFQAACLGLVKAMKKSEDVEYFRSYAYACMKAEVIKEMAALHDPLPLDHKTFLLLCEYNKAKNSGVDVESLPISRFRKDSLRELSEAKRLEYREVPVKE
jgi:RNA polymerase sigma factor (sigma-70 family)